MGEYGSTSKTELIQMEWIQEMGKPSDVLKIETV